MWQSKYRTWASPLLAIAFGMLVWTFWQSQGRDQAPNIVERETTLDGTVFVGVLNMKGSGRLGTIVEVDRQSKEVWKYVLPESINPPETGLLDVEPTQNDSSGRRGSENRNGIFSYFLWYVTPYGFQNQTI